MSYETFLHLVSRPARYISIEKNRVCKQRQEEDLSVVLCFPEVYEIGMSHLGIRILYHLLNEQPKVICERVFAPWFDMEEQLRKRNQPLLSLESQTRICEFDVLGFSLQSELTFTNVINILDLSNIPVFAKDRHENDPLIICGGPAAVNPEPFCEFMDAILIGDGEKAVLELANWLQEAKNHKLNREETLFGVSFIQGFYVPRFYQEHFDESGVYLGVKPIRAGVPERILRRWVEELDMSFYPKKPIVSHTQAIQDRHVVEVVRGCTQGCRFCQAGYIYRPIRELSIDQISSLVKDGLDHTGFDSVGLVSLSTADYSEVKTMVQEVTKITTPRNVSLSLPSLRADRMSVELADSVKEVKRNGFTFAPEAGSARLRRIINKNITNEQLFDAAKTAFEKGWQLIKLYFMVGLPQETSEDIEETIDLIKELEMIAKKSKGKNTITVSFGPFVPKAHTPFQWEAFAGVEEIMKTILYIRSKVMSPIVKFKYQAPHLSHFEAIISKGDRSVARGLYQAFLDGHRFEGWSECFSYEKMMESLKKCGLDVDRITGVRDQKDVLPWDHIDIAIKKQYFKAERKRAFEEKTTTDCRFGDCHYCGIPDPKTDIRLRGRDVVLAHSISQSSAEIPVLKSAQTMNRGNTLRYRFFYTKKGLSRFLAHSDLVRAFQMALSVCRVQSLYSKGFSPRPVMQFGPVLPLGAISLHEILDLWSEEEINEEMVRAINENLPAGVEVLEAKNIVDKRSISVVYPLALYRLTTLDGDLELFEKIKKGVEKFFGYESYKITHREKQIDLKSAIRNCSVLENGVELVLSVCSGTSSNAGPFIVMKHLFGIEEEDAGRVCVTKILSVKSEDSGV